MVPSTHPKSDSRVLPPLFLQICRHWWLRSSLYQPRRVLSVGVLGGVCNAIVPTNQNKTYGHRPSVNGQIDKMHRTPSVRSSEFRPRFMDGVKCYSCNEKCHLASNCLQKALFCSLLPSQPCQKQTERHGKLNGTYSQDIVIDTGASKTLVRSDFVSPDTFVDPHLKVVLGGSEFRVQAAVVEKFPAAALLGWDVPNLMDLVKRDKQVQVLALLRDSKGDRENARLPLSPTTLTRLAPIPIARYRNLSRPPPKTTGHRTQLTMEHNSVRYFILMTLFSVLQVPTNHV